MLVRLEVQQYDEAVVDVVEHPLRKFDFKLFVTFIRPVLIAEPGPFESRKEMKSVRCKLPLGRKEH